MRDSDTGAPYVRGSDTSRAAAASIEEHRSRMIARVLAAFKAAPDGMTDQEAQERTGMGPQTEGPRRIELQRLGLVVNSGRKRKTRSGRDATVWVYSGGAV